METLLNKLAKIGFVDLFDQKPSMNDEIEMVVKKGPAYIIDPMSPNDGLFTVIETEPLTLTNCKKHKMEIHRINSGIRLWRKHDPNNEPFSNKETDDQGVEIDVL